MLHESFGDKAYKKLPLIAPGLVVREKQSCYSALSTGYELVKGDCFSWMAQRQPNTIHAIGTDPPYGLKEYTPNQKAKLRLGKGGVWRLPPAHDGIAKRPRAGFTVLSEEDKRELKNFFARWSTSTLRVLVPRWIDVCIATNPLLSHLVYQAMMDSWLPESGGNYSLGSNVTWRRPS